MRLSGIACSWIVALLVIGCTNHSKSGPDSIPITGNAIHDTQLFVDEAGKQVVAAKPHTDGEGKVHLDTATDQLISAHKQANIASADLGKVSKDFQAVQKTLDKSQSDYKALESKWYVKLGRLIVRAVWLLVGVLAAGLVLRIVSGFASGPIGSIAGVASSAIFAVLSHGVTLLVGGVDRLTNHVASKQPAKQ